jgi:hypothetical protein
MPDGFGAGIRRLLRRLTGGDAEMRELAQSIRKLTEAQRDQTTTLQGRLTALSDVVTQRSSSKDATEILHAVRALASATDQETGSLYQALDAIAKGRGPIVAGPWTGEVGFELLYWVPFLEWFRTRWRVAPERFVIVSRGGVESWYGMPGARYADIFSHMPPAAFRARTDPDAHKQREVSDLDREIVAAVSAAHGLEGATHLHPRLMYRAFAPFWKDEAGFGLIERCTSHRAMKPVDDPVAAGLPSEFVAARFYFSDCFRDNPQNRAVARSVIDAASARLPVVLLNPGVRVDDHADYAPPANGRVIDISAGLSPERNLAVQSAVISRARAFVGTYGGYSYLAPFYGVPAVGFYSDRTFKLHHLHVAQRVFERLGPATVVAVDTAHAELVHALTAVV